MKDLRFAFRQLFKAPGFTVIAVLSLALGIGANTAIFSVVHAVLLAPLPYADANRLYMIQSRHLQRNLTGEPLAPAAFREFEKQVSAFEKVAATRYNYVNLTRVEKPTQLTDSLVTQDFFDVLGVKPLLGRTFVKEDGAGGAVPSIVLSYELWQKQFGGRPEIVGDTITLDDVAHTVIGVMPRGFKDAFNVSSCWRILPNEGGENLTANARFWAVIGRLKAGVSPDGAEAELSTIAARLAQVDPKSNEGWDFTLRPLRDVVVGEYRDGLVLVICAALVVLLITCANVAGLQLVRASTRHREVAICLAIGASRAAVARQQLVESLLLVTLGAAGGILLGSWGLDLILGTLSTEWIPRSDEIAINFPVLLATGASAFVSGLAFGFYPAMRATRVNAMDALRDQARGSTGPESVRVRASLVVGQIALTLVLLVCAGLVLKSFAALNRVNPGVDTEHTLSMVVSLAPARYETPQKRSEYYRQLVERVGTVPGVEHAGFTQTMPFTWGIPGNFSLEGGAGEEAKLPRTFYDSVSPSYFQTMRIPLIAGRLFTESDNENAPRVVLISHATAKKFFPNEDPIGKRLLSTGQAGPAPVEIVGVVGDVPRNGLGSETPYQVYASLNQRSWNFATLVVRSRLPVETLAASVQREIWKLNPEQPVTNVKPVRDLVKASIVQPQLYLMLFSLFALLALLLAALGLYGLVAYSVTQRTREFGIRMALGAQKRDVLQLVLRDGAKLTIAGVLLGVVGAVAVARLMQSLLFRTAAYDPAVYIAVLVLLGAIATLAALLPARRATHLDPTTALRAE